MSILDFKYNYNDPITHDYYSTYHTLIIIPSLINKNYIHYKVDILMTQKNVNHCR